MCAHQFHHTLLSGFFLLLRKVKNQDFISSIPVGSIGSFYIFTRPQKWPKTCLLGLLYPFHSITRANSLHPSPDSDSMGKNLVISRSSDFFQWEPLFLTLDLERAENSTYKMFYRSRSFQGDMKVK